MSRTTLTIDVDLAEEDLRRDPIDVAIPGLGVYEFPGVMPALAMIRVSRWSTQKRKNLKPEETIALMGDIVPEEVFADWASQGFDVFDEQNQDTIEKIVTAVLNEYMRRQGDSATTGKAQPVTSESSSTTGTSSLPTSDVSTVSPFHVT